MQVESKSNTSLIFHGTISDEVLIWLVQQDVGLCGQALKISSASAQEIRRNDDGIMS